jgi:hypothetical protein
MRSSALLLAVLAALVAGCGGDDKKTDTPVVVKPGLTPFPSVDRADLEPGRKYTTQQFKPSITLKIPEGDWIAAGADSADHVEIEPTPEDPVDSSALAFHHMIQVFDPATGGVTPGDAVPGPDDFAAWLTGHPHLKATKPKPVEALGLKGVAIDVRVKSSQPRRYKDCGKVLGDCVVMFVGKVEPIVYGSKSLGRFYVLEQPDGKELVVEQYVEPASALKAQQPAFDAILESARVAG